MSPDSPSLALLSLLSTVIALSDTSTSFILHPAPQNLSPVIQ